MDTTPQRRAADNMRVLIAAMVEKARSGHPGGAMGGADFASVLYSGFINYDPENPCWFARDRFFLDPGHMSPMLYSVLALAGLYSMDELKDFRQWGSVTTGHPELDPTRGIENGSGPLGQGHVMAVGCAIAERVLAAQFGEVVSHKTYAYISDGGIQEEISQGAGRIAGYLKLHNLIMFYDANDVQLSTRVDEVTGEDTAAKYRAWGWNVLDIDGCDAAAIAGALQTAIEEKEKPTLIIGHTVMARSCVTSQGESCEGWVSTHGQPLSKAGVDVNLTISRLGGDPENPWQIWDDVRALFAQRREELHRNALKRQEAEAKWAEENPELAKRLYDYINGVLPEIDWSAIAIKPGGPTRAASSAVLGVLSEKLGNMVVSSADLANSDKTDGFLRHTHAMGNGDFTGRFLHAGVAELTMACLMNGIVLHGGMMACCGTFFVFSDYMKPAIRMGAMMKLPVKYVFTHDSFRVGEDGPTHQPVEHELQMRLMEQMRNFDGSRSLLVLRPADGAEAVACWHLAVDNNGSPTVLILTRQDVPDLETGLTFAQVEEGVRRGGYPVVACENPDVVLVANGSEVGLLCKVADKLREEGIRPQVVSVPSIGLFLDQDEEYRNKVIPCGVPQFGLTAGLPMTLAPVMCGCNSRIYGMERFGSSAPAKVLDEKFGYTPEHIFEQVKLFLASKV